MKHAICLQADGTQLNLEVLLAKGAQPGPTLLLLGCVHGDEYEGPEAIWEAFSQIDPAQLAGTVVAIPVANPPAYRAGQRANPEDGKDLARTFPGSRKGSVTEQIAWHLQQQFIQHASFLCDFHSAGRFYKIDPWVGYAMVADEELLQTQRQAAKIVGYPTAWGTQLLPGRSLWAAAQCNVPALYVEAPGEGRVHRKDVERNLLVIRQLLAYLKISGELKPIVETEVVEDSREDSGYLQVQMVASAGGYFRSAVQLSQDVTEGETFGEILDPGGNTIETVHAPTSGRIVFLRTFPVLQAGDSLGTIREKT